mgnify:FL=1
MGEKVLPYNILLIKFRTVFIRNRDIRGDRKSKGIERTRPEETQRTEKNIEQKGCCRLPNFFNMKFS